MKMKCNWSYKCWKQFNKKYYWIACGNAIIPCPIPLRPGEFAVSPIPNALLGFETEAEQSAALDELLVNTEDALFEERFCEKVLSGKCICGVIEDYDPAKDFDLAKDVSPYATFLVNRDALYT